MVKRDIIDVKLDCCFADTFFESKLKDKINLKEFMDDEKTNW